MRSLGAKGEEGVKAPGLDGIEQQVGVWTWVSALFSLHTTRMTFDK